MEITKYSHGELESNCYLVTSGGEALVTDPGDRIDGLVEAIQGTDSFLRYILLTHGHYDHVLGVDWLKKSFPTVSVVIGEGDVPLLKSLPEQGEFFGARLPEILAEPVGVTDGSILPFGDEVIKVLTTPGHTKGSVCYEVAGNIFTGDTLFYHTYGRIDLPHSEPGEMKESLKKLFALPGELKVYPGHGPTTTLKEEKDFYG